MQNALKIKEALFFLVLFFHPAVKLKVSFPTAYTNLLLLVEVGLMRLNLLNFSI